MEARINLHRERNETPEKLMGIYSLNKDSFNEMLASAEKKVIDAESKGGLFRGYDPICPDSTVTLDW